MLQAAVGVNKLHTNGRNIATGRLHLPRGSLQTARLHREWLRSVVDKTGMPLTRIAKTLGIAPSTLTRPVSEGNAGTSTLHAATIEKISAFTGIAGPEAETQAAARRPRGLAEEAAPFDSSEPGLTAAVRAIVAGRNGVDPWTLRTRTLEAAGYLPGDVVILDMNPAPAAGDVVCAQVYDWAGGKAETVWRVYDPPVLIGAPFDVAARPKSLIVDNERVVIRGVVVGMIRPPGARAA